MQVSVEVAEIINLAFSLAENAGFEYVTPELVLYVICENPVFARAFENCGGRLRELDYHLRTYLDEYMEPADANSENRPQFSIGMMQVLTQAWESARNCDKEAVELSHVLHAMFGLEESYAVYYMRGQGVEEAELLQEMLLVSEDLAYEKGQGQDKDGRARGRAESRNQLAADGQEEGLSERQRRRRDGVPADSMDEEEYGSEEGDGSEEECVRRKGMDGSKSGRTSSEIRGGMSGEAPASPGRRAGLKRRPRRASGGGTQCV